MWNLKMKNSIKFGQLFATSRDIMFLLKRITPIRKISILPKFVLTFCRLCSFNPSTNTFLILNLSLVLVKHASTIQSFIQYL